MSEFPEMNNSRKSKSYKSSQNIKESNLKHLQYFESSKNFETSSSANLGSKRHSKNTFDFNTNINNQLPKSRKESVSALNNSFRDKINSYKDIQQSF